MRELSVLEAEGATFNRAQSFSALNEGKSPRSRPWSIGTSRSPVDNDATAAAVHRDPV